MIEASRLNDLVVERLIKEVNKGYTEKELADKLLDIYHDLGSEGFSFYPICCYGANAADPHQVHLKYHPLADTVETDFPYFPMFSLLF